MQSCLSAYHLLITKLSHSAVSLWRNARFLCIIISLSRMCFSVSDITLPHQTVNTSTISMNTQMNDSSIVPMIHAIAMIRDTKMYTMSCSFSLVTFDCLSYSISRFSPHEQFCGVQTSWQQLFAVWTSFRSFSSYGQVWFERLQIWIIAPSKFLVSASDHKSSDMSTLIIHELPGYIIKIKVHPLLCFCLHIQVYPARFLYFKYFPAVPVARQFFSPTGEFWNPPGLVYRSTLTWIKTKKEGNPDYYTPLIFFLAHLVY